VVQRRAQLPATKSFRNCVTLSEMLMQAATTFEHADTAYYLLQ
jgi:hypothetical protein